MKNKNKKVYCSNCEYVTTRHHRYECLFIIDIKYKDSPLMKEKLITYADCYTHNKNNDCKFYRNSLSFKIKKLATYIFEDENNESNN